MKPRASTRRTRDRSRLPATGSSFRPRPIMATTTAVGERCSELLAEVEDHAALIALRAMDDAEVGIKPCLDERAPDLSIQHAVDVVDGLVHGIARVPRDANFEARVRGQQRREMRPVCGCPWRPGVGIAGRWSGWSAVWSSVPPLASDAAEKAGNQLDLASAQLGPGCNPLAQREGRGGRGVLAGCRRALCAPRPSSARREDPPRPRKGGLFVRFRGRLESAQ